jgi:hypothetical protein
VLLIVVRRSSIGWHPEKDKGEHDNLTSRSKGSRNELALSGHYFRTLVTVQSANPFIDLIWTCVWTCVWF